MAFWTESPGEYLNEPLVNDSLRLYCSVLGVVGEGGIEIVKSDGFPYIDFKTHEAGDYDVRLTLDGGAGFRWIAGGDGSASQVMNYNSSGCLGVNFNNTASDIRIRLQKDGSWPLVFAATGSGPDIVLFGEAAMLFDNTNNALVPYNNTTASGANVVAEQISGYLVEIKRSTSSIKYKSDVKNSNHGLEKVLGLRSVQFKPKTQNDHDQKLYAGLIAEEVHELGLTEFIEYNERDEPENIGYGRMVALLAKAIQELKLEIDDLRVRAEKIVEGN